MRVCEIRRAVVWLLLALPAAAQQSEPQDAPELIGAPAPGSALSLPVPNSRQMDMSRYDIPELAGAQAAHGSHLVEGRLPRPVADYSALVGKVQQRISIFENGIVAVSMKGAGGTIRKRIRIPPDALEAYRKALQAEALDEFINQTLSSTSDRAVLRIYRDDRSHVERTFNPTFVQSAFIDQPLNILKDLLRALSEDREATNPLTGYTPRVGDHLVSDDEQTYRVVAILQNGEYLELVSTREPLTLYVATKDLHNYFIGRRKTPPRR